MMRWLQVAVAIGILGPVVGFRGEPEPGVAPPPRPAGLNIRPGYTTVPLHRGSFTGWLYVEVQINGKAARLLLDTGAPMCVLHVQSAERFGYAPTGPAIPFALNGGAAAEFRQMVRPKLTVGSLTDPAVGFQLMSAPILGPAFVSDGLPCDGLLGASFLHAYAAVVDYPAGLLHLRDPLDVESDLQGRWVCVGREVGGEALGKNQYSQYRLQVRGSVLTITVQGREFPFRIGIDPSARPKRMDLVEKDDFTVPMIYRLEEGRLVIAAALFEPRGRVGSRPVEFRSKAGSPISVMTFEKGP